MTLQERIEAARFRVRNWWRKQMRSPFYTDLRLVALEYRHLYSEQMRTANCGTAIGLLLLAYNRGHLRSQRAKEQPNEG